jgi:hypothetical protein
MWNLQREIHGARRAFYRIESRGPRAFASPLHTAALGENTEALNAVFLKF